MIWQDIILLNGIVVAVYTDLRYGTIKNWLTAPLFLLGCLAAYLSGGWLQIFEGIAAGAGMAFLTFMFSTPGGGDLKLALAVGPWVGMPLFPAYLFGALGLRVVLNLLIRMKMRDWNPVMAFSDAATELKTWQVTRLGKSNFRVFQNAAEKCGGDPDMPAIPGALWVAGGVISAILLKGVIL